MPKLRTTFITLINFKNLTIFSTFKTSPYDIKSNFEKGIELIKSNKKDP